MTLETFFHENPRVALAFSGGVDSAYLLYAARACGAQVRAYYVQTAFQPAFEREDALRLVRELGAEMTVLPLDILDPGGGLRQSAPALLPLQAGNFFRYFAGCRRGRL